MPNTTNNITGAFVDGVIHRPRPGGPVIPSLQVPFSVGDPPPS